MSVSGTCSRLRGLLLATAIMTAAGCMEKHPGPVEPPPPIVAVAAPVEAKVTDYQIFTARTQAVDSVDVKARVTGYLEKINFKDGDEVKKDKVLFEIDDRPYKASLDQAKAALEVAKSSLDQAKASQQIATATLVKTQADYDIGLKVQKDNPGAISEQEIIKRRGARDEATGSINKAKAAIEEATSSIEKAKAALVSAQLNYDWCKVTAPISGRINQHFISAGNLVNADVTLLTNIVSLKPTWAYFDADQNTVERYQKLVSEGKVKSARTSEVPVQMGLGTDKSFPISGVIDFLSNQLDPNTGSIRLRAVFPNTDEKLVAGLFARIRVPISSEHSALLVNDLAIGTDQGQKFVFVVNDKDEVEVRPVEVGQVHDGLREVYRFRQLINTDPQGKEVVKEVEVLKLTDRLIVDGLQRVRPRIKVQPKPVDMRTLLAESK